MPTARPVGRPRDVSIDNAAIEATRSLLVDVGFDATTMQAIARRAGVHTSALYRRWPSRIELIERAAFPGFSAETVRPTGDLRADLHAFAGQYLDAFGSPVARAAMPALLASRKDQDRATRDARYFEVSTRPYLLDILRAAGTRRVDPALDPDDVFDLLLGAIVSRHLIPTIAQRDRPIDHTIELIVRALRPVNRDQLGRTA
ncbi:MAG TPA: TetR/AcrR family transcriptional regulator [Mycobacteriales bacterium]|nr:TetR/AcrR family transcriptional regulator [Mycobacteriales bacterium]